MNPRLRSYIATRDHRVAKLRGYDFGPLARYFDELELRGSVRVGGRATSGPKTDLTWIEFRLWNEVVRKARSMGYAIEETNVAQHNAWATVSGGFWEEREYRLVQTVPQRMDGV